MDSSGESDLESIILYRERPEWADVKPVPQDDGPNPIVKIAYSEEFEDVYDYFRGIMRTEEKSQRALELTADAIRLNPANYTVWHYRRLIIKEIGADLKEELLYISNIIKAHPKNYQVWFHRQKIVEWLDDPSTELEFTASVLAIDSKNYHAWQHRQWVLETYKLWADELNSIDQFIDQDIRNNSAWNQRYFVISKTTDYTPEVLETETQYSMDKINKARNNESPWSYLRGILALSFYDKYPKVVEFCEKLYEGKCRSPHLLSTMVDICEQNLQRSPSKQELDRALELCAELAMEFDTIRASYWTFIGDGLEKKYRPMVESLA